ncbi:hypothetical protein ANCDUO_12460 [Ancylostoma duodenale]|uniref:Uncharacterized protein n=1 Tax=Ancylostoma duodenale TaxID=51022 RepID=A0A0C2G8U8_9BILA|nr:hypothetical protein ANCDUO_12460 [Ancylostoma duodenale]
MTECVIQAVPVSVSLAGQVTCANWNSYGVRRNHVSMVNVKRVPMDGSIASVIPDSNNDWLAG